MPAKAWTSSYRSSQLRDGIYFGIFVDGALVAMAGTHGVSKSDRIAVVGNVFTHPRHRNSHFALQDHQRCHPRIAR